MKMGFIAYISTSKYFGGRQQEKKRQTLANRAQNAKNTIRPAEVLRISKAIGVGVEELFAEESDVESQII